ncbi:hypothetical protein ACQKFG_19870 [Peribacillus sp. NPDC076916]|uniref:hypothetical protein n=1 Tax=Peribacillus sp. NPDC076916 TaxID=3390608 RepID=UPI003CFE95C9
MTIREIEEEVRVEIEDKGKGFDIEKVTRGVGLFSMEERARASGGLNNTVNGNSLALL